MSVTTNLSREWIDLLRRSARGPIEVSLDSIGSALGLAEDLPTLERATVLRQAIGDAGLMLRPGFDVGDFATVRLLQASDDERPADEVTGADIARGECQEIEFKSTYQFDVNRARANPGSPPETLRSKEVRSAALEAIAALLNTGGGRVYIGIDDDGQRVGLDRDVSLLRSDRQSFDGLQSQIRADVREMFLDGGAINDYLQIAQCGELASGCVSIRVTARSKLSFLRVPWTKDQRYLLFRRQGATSVEVPVEQVEEFVSMRKASSTET